MCKDMLHFMLFCVGCDDVVWSTRYHAATAYVNISLPIDYHFVPVAKPKQTLFFEHPSLTIIMYSNTIQIVPVWFIHS